MRYNILSALYWYSSEHTSVNFVLRVSGQALKWEIRHSGP